MIGIYKYTNKINGKIYIGRSINITKRKWEHLNQPSPYSYFDQTICKIGADKFDFKVLEECSVEELEKKEKYYIQLYDCYATDEGYNLTPGGEEHFGENNISAKLTEKDVLNIIEELKNSYISIQDIAKEYNVHYNTISNINRCKTWKHLHNFKKNIRKEFKMKRGDD